jgi:hypothetical protein
MKMSDEERAKRLIDAAPELYEVLRIMVEEDSRVVALDSPHDLLTIKRAIEVLRKVGWEGLTYEYLRKSDWFPILR